MFMSRFIRTDYHVGQNFIPHRAVTVQYLLSPMSLYGTIDFAATVPATDDCAGQHQVVSHSQRYRDVRLHPLSEETLCRIPRFDRSKKTFIDVEIHPQTSGFCSVVISLPPKILSKL